MTTVVMVGRDDFDVHAAARRFAQPLVKWKCDVGTRDKNKVTRTIDYVENSLKYTTILKTIKGEQFDIAKRFMAGSIGSIPSAEKVRAQKRDRLIVVYPHHHVMPGRVVLTE